MMPLDKKMAQRLLMREAKARLKRVRESNTKTGGQSLFSMSCFMQGGEHMWDLLLGATPKHEGEAE